jgi:hypothetical protein
MNLINGNPRLLERSVRRALNEALHQPHLLWFVFGNEAQLSPISPLFPGVSQVSQRLLPFPRDHDPYAPEVQRRLRETLDGLTLKVLSQDRYMPLWRGIETQFDRVGVKLDIEFVNSEKEIFDPLLKTNAQQNEKDWDLLVWGNDDWYFNHPYTAFFVYRTTNVWSTVYDDPIMNDYIEDMFRIGVTEPGFPAICEKIMRRAYDESYMLFVPTPNKVYAVNKEVIFHPYTMACMPLWKIAVTDQHWSVRQGDYPQHLTRPMHSIRINDQ